MYSRTDCTPAETCGVRCSSRCGREPLRVCLTTHALKRLREERQGGITMGDVVSAVARIPGYVVYPTRFCRLRGSGGRLFDAVICDKKEGRVTTRVVITLIGRS